MEKIVINLPKAHAREQRLSAARGDESGQCRGVGMRPQPGMVSRLVIQPQIDAWCFFRMDEHGGFVGESWHPTKEDALHQAKREFGVERDENGD